MFKNDALIERVNTESKHNIGLWSMLSIVFNADTKLTLSVRGPILDDIIERRSPHWKGKIFAMAVNP